MPSANKEAVQKALKDFIALGRAVGLPKVVLPLEKFLAEFENTKPTLKILQGPVHAAFSKAFLAIREKVYDMGMDKPRPGMKEHNQEFDRAARAFSDAIFPPAFVETEVVGLAGNKKSTTVIGDPKDAKAIAKQSLDVIQKFSDAVFQQDLGAAYKLCANEWRTNMSIEQFAASLKSADSKYGGAAVDLIMEYITWIYADADARKKSNSDGDWPKETPKQNKRSLVGGFWLTDKKQKSGRSVFFWITEEAEGYRIAKFKQYLQ
jgi:hypothetical protein